MSKKVLLHITDTENITVLHKIPEDEKHAAKHTAVIMVHDFPGHKAGKNDLFGKLEDYLHEHHYHTIRFDFRGCGASDGIEEGFSLKRAQEDLKVLMFWAHKEGYKKFIVIAEGLGAALAMRYIDRQTKGLILLWPVLDPRKYHEYLTAGLKNEAEARKKGFYDFHGYRIGFGLVDELEHHDLIFEMKDVVPPTAIMHGSQDPLCTMQDLELVREHLGAERIDITTFHGGDHGLNAEKLRGGLMRQIHGFIEQNICPPQKT